MALIISESDFNKVANFFGKNNVRRSRNGGTSIIVTPNNKIMNDNRDNTVQYELYRYNDGFRWRRSVLNYFGEPEHYQLFRNGTDYAICCYGKYPTNYIYESFETVDAALVRFVKYVIKHKMCA